MAGSGDTADGAGGRGPAWVPEVRLPMSRLTPYLRVGLAVADGELRWEVPRTLVGLVAFGVRRVAVPVGEVRRVRMRAVVYPLRLILGTAGVALPLAFGAWWVAGPAALAGLWVALLSVGLAVEVETREGKRHRAAVCLRHRLDAEMYAAAVNDLEGKGGAL